MQRVLRPFVIASLVAMMATAALAADQSTPPEPKVKTGDMAPDFTLRDQSGKQVKLSDFRGKKNVVLAFYVFAFTGG